MRGDHSWGQIFTLHQVEALQACIKMERCVLSPLLGYAIKSFSQLYKLVQGTVDSGHSCITGYNEVVMLRRMPEEHKHFAAEQLGYDGVHRLPHDVGTKYENIWPKKSVIKKWEEMK